MAITMDITMDKRIDLHTHILPGVDDGAKSINESLNIIDYLARLGITDIVLTSHYIKGTGYNYNVKDRLTILEELEKNLNGREVSLYIGNEVYLCDEVVDLYKKKEICTINNSKYMLVELPLSSYYKNFPNALCDLNEHKIVPIIAHPERYKFIQNDKDKISKILEFDCLLQINIDSLTGKYGRKAKKIAKFLLKKDLVSFVATDTHYVSDPDKLEKSYKKLKKIVGKEKYEELVYKNPRKVLENKKIDVNLSYIERKAR